MLEPLHDAGPFGQQDVAGVERLDAAVDRRRLLLVALVADERELRPLDEARIDGRDPDRPAE